MGYKSERGTNKLHEPQSGSRAICLLCAPIHSPWTQKKDTHSLYLKCFHQRSFIKLSEKTYKFKFLLFTGTLNLIGCKSLHAWFIQLPDYLLTEFIGNWIENFCMVQWKKYNTIVDISWWLYFSRKFLRVLRFKTKVLTYDFNVRIIEADKQIVKISLLNISWVVSWQKWGHASNKCFTIVY